MKTTLETASNITNISQHQPVPGTHTLVSALSENYDARAELFQILHSKKIVNDEGKLGPEHAERPYPLLTTDLALRLRKDLKAISPFMGTQQIEIFGSCLVSIFSDADYLDLILQQLDLSDHFDAIYALLQNNIYKMQGNFHIYVPTLSGEMQSSELEMIALKSQDSQQQHVPLTDLKITVLQNTNRPPTLQLKSIQASGMQIFIDTVLGVFSVPEPQKITDYTACFEFVSKIIKGQTCSTQNIETKIFALLVPFLEDGSLAEKICAWRDRHLVEGNALTMAFTFTVCHFLKKLPSVTYDQVNDLWLRIERHYEKKPYALNPYSLEQYEMFLNIGIICGSFEVYVITSEHDANGALRVHFFSDISLLLDWQPDAAWQYLIENPKIWPNLKAELKLRSQGNLDPNKELFLFINQYNEYYAAICWAKHLKTSKEIEQRILLKPLMVLCMLNFLDAQERSQLISIEKIHHWMTLLKIDSSPSPEHISLVYQLCYEVLRIPTSLQLDTQLIELIQTVSGMVDGQLIEQLIDKCGLKKGSEEHLELKKLTDMPPVQQQPLSPEIQTGHTTENTLDYVGFNTQLQNPDLTNLEKLGAAICQHLQHAAALPPEKRPSVNTEGIQQLLPAFEKANCRAKLLWSAYLYNLSLTESCREFCLSAFDIMVHDASWQRTEVVQVLTYIKKYNFSSYEHFDSAARSCKNFENIELGRYLALEIFDWEASLSQSQQIDFHALLREILHLRPDPLFAFLVSDELSKQDILNRFWPLFEETKKRPVLQTAIKKRVETVIGEPLPNGKDFQGLWLQVMFQFGDAKSAFNFWYPRRHVCNDYVLKTEKCWWAFGQILLERQEVTEARLLYEQKTTKQRTAVEEQFKLELIYKESQTQVEKTLAEDPQKALQQVLQASKHTTPEKAIDALVILFQKGVTLTYEAYHLFIEKLAQIRTIDPAHAHVYGKMVFNLLNMPKTNRTQKLPRHEVANVLDRLLPGLENAIFAPSLLRLIEQHNINLRNSEENANFCYEAFRSISSEEAHETLIPLANFIQKKFSRGVQVHVFIQSCVTVAERLNASKAYKQAIVWLERLLSFSTLEQQVLENISSLGLKIAQNLHAAKEYKQTIPWIERLLSFAPLEKYTAAVQSFLLENFDNFYSDISTKEKIATLYKFYQRPGAKSIDRFCTLMIDLIKKEKDYGTLFAIFDKYTSFWDPATIPSEVAELKTCIKDRIYEILQQVSVKDSIKLSPKKYEEFVNLAFKLLKQLSVDFAQQPQIWGYLVGLTAWAYPQRTWEALELASQNSGDIKEEIVWLVSEALCSRQDPHILKFFDPRYTNYLDILLNPFSAEHLEQYRRFCESAIHSIISDPSVEATPLIPPKKAEEYKYVFDRLLKSLPILQDRFLSAPLPPAAIGDDPAECLFLASDYEALGNQENKDALLNVLIEQGKAWKGPDKDFQGNAEGLNTVTLIILCNLLQLPWLKHDEAKLSLLGLFFKRPQYVSLWCNKYVSALSRSLCRALSVPTKHTEESLGAIKPIIEKVRGALRLFSTHRSFMSKEEMSLLQQTEKLFAAIEAFFLAASGWSADPLSASKQEWEQLNGEVSNLIPTWQRAKDIYVRSDQKVSIEFGFDLTTHTSTLITESSTLTQATETLGEKELVERYLQLMRILCYEKNQVFLSLNAHIRSLCSYKQTLLAVDMLLRKNAEQQVLSDLKAKNDKNIAEAELFAMYNGILDYLYADSTSEAAIKAAALLEKLLSRNWRQQIIEEATLICARMRVYIFLSKFNLTDKYPRSDLPNLDTCCFKLLERQKQLEKCDLSLMLVDKDLMCNTIFDFVLAISKERKPIIFFDVANQAFSLGKKFVQANLISYQELFGYLSTYLTTIFNLIKDKKVDSHIYFFQYLTFHRYMDFLLTNIKDSTEHIPCMEAFGRFNDPQAMFYEVFPNKADQLNAMNRLLIMSIAYSDHLFVILAFIQRLKNDIHTILQGNDNSINQCKLLVIKYLQALTKGFSCTQLTGQVMIVLTQDEADYTKRRQDILAFILDFFNALQEVPQSERKLLFILTALDTLLNAIQESDQSKYSSASLFFYDVVHYYLQSVSLDEKELPNLIQHCTEKYELITAGSSTKLWALHLNEWNKIASTLFTPYMAHTLEIALQSVYENPLIINDQQLMKDILGGIANLTIWLAFAKDTKLFSRVYELLKTKVNTPQTQAAILSRIVVGAHAATQDGKRILDTQNEQVVKIDPSTIELIKDEITDLAEELFIFLDDKGYEQPSNKEHLLNILDDLK